MNEPASRRPRRPARVAMLLLGAIVIAAGAPGARATPPPAAAADPTLEQAKEAFERGEKAYNLGKFAEALDHYERAYELKPLPELLYNLGQCHRNLGHYERAAFFYEGYLRGNPKARNRPAVEGLIKQMNEKVEEERRAKVQQPVQPRPQVIPVAPAPDVGKPDPLVVPAVPDEAAKETPVHKRWYVWTIFGLVVAGGVGTGVGVAAANPSTDYTRLMGSLGVIGGPPGAN